MKVLLLTTHLNTGGITSYLFTLAKELVKEGHQVYVISSGGDAADRFQQAGATPWTFNIRTKSEISWRLFWTLPHLVKFIQAAGIDIIHANTRVTQVLAALASRSTKVPYVSTCHGFFKPRVFRRLFPAWGKAVIAISPAVRDHLQKDFRVPAADIALIKNGLDIADYPPVTEAMKKAVRMRLNVTGGPVLGIIARLSDVKGHAVLIAAMMFIVEKFPDARLVIVGQGKLEAELRQQVDMLGLTSQVMFMPIVNRTAEVLPLFDVFVMPSLQEGLGLSVMEAQASGLAVVASRVGGLPSLIEDGRTGRLVTPNDSRELADVILDILQKPDEARDMGLNARAFIEKEFSAPAMARETVALYQRVWNKVS